MILEASVISSSVFHCSSPVAYWRRATKLTNWKLSSGEACPSRGVACPSEVFGICDPSRTEDGSSRSLSMFGRIAEGDGSAGLATGDVNASDSCPPWEEEGVGVLDACPPEFSPEDVGAGNGSGEFESS